MRYDLSSQTLRVRDIYRLGWDIFTRNRIVMLVLFITSTLPSALSEVMLNNYWDVDLQQPGDLGYSILSSMIASLFSFIAVIGLTWMTANDVRENRFTIDQLFVAVGRCFLPILIGAIGWAILFFIGMLFLFVPGILVMVWYAFFPAFIVIERKGILTAFSDSYRLVQGRFFHVLGMSLAVTLPAIAIGMLMELGVTTPLSMFFVLAVSSLIMFYPQVMFTVFFLNVRSTWKLPEERGGVSSETGQGESGLPPLEPFPSESPAP